MNTSILDISVSGFANVKSTEPKPVNLLTWLHSDKYRHEVELIRQAATKDERTRLKQNLPCITPSGTFTKRNQAGLVKHSGFMCLDIDSQDNTHIANFSELKNHLANISNFAYVGLSVSGNGYFCLVPIAEPDKHKLHFKALQEDMAGFGIVLDKSGSDITRLRFYSYDSEAYYNDQAEVYTKIYQEPVKVFKPRKRQSNAAHQTTAEPVEIIRNLIRFALDGEKHFKLYKAARLAGGFIKGNQITEREAVEVLKSEIEAKNNVCSLEAAYKTIEDGIKDGKNAPIETETTEEPEPEPPPPPKLTKLTKLTIVPQHKNEVEELIEYFDSVKLPEAPVKLNNYTTITDTRQFVENHIQTYKNITNDTYRQPYLERLRALKAKFETSTEYTYRGDKLTDTNIKGKECKAVRRHSGKCIRGKNGNMLVEFENGKKVVVLGRQLRKIKTSDSLSDLPEVNISRTEQR